MESAPPTYAQAEATPMSTSSIPGSLGFPTGYFVIRSLATGRVFDISGAGTNDGTKVHLWKAKEASLVAGEYASDLLWIKLCTFEQTSEIPSPTIR